MISNNSKILLTFAERGESLVRPGVYKTASITVKNGFTKNEVFKVNKAMKVIKPAVYSKSTVQITLGSGFVEAALERPEKPEGKSFNRWVRESLGKAFLEWKKLSPEQRIAANVEQYVLDMGGEKYSYEII